ncbi:MULTISPECIES: isocitrate lyase/PEP mutase family protein [unclassified Streptomyces]|uniref:isocitrate lyase/PEP mutase family protein n=1 Tax=unclassified Streptomyces TaxID=2593676 RepID=UPI0013186CEF|nr:MULTISPECIES: isocitrate lyase/phosphoenolpyruvate mutase family protein [unclassified Streptomyces]QHC32059.1 isocitrate lyase/phosphoenolpyruvate mutase family protein [Streptomyces sp. HF10]WKE68952.1 isocitrate lyase/phosphoenolpyruvate mutase family protein [Streptomyces sp. WP-1]
MTADLSVTSFAALHRPGEPLLLPNAWDHASAAALAARGFPAIATSSLAVAAGVGLPDGAAATREHTVRLALTLGAGSYHLSVDAEDGFGDDPGEVARLAAELWAAGAVGVNLEDGLGASGLLAAKIRAVKAAVPGMFVNARTDTYWSGDGDEQDTLRRLDAYQQAGADGVFVPGLTDPARIAALVRHLGAPLNLLHSPAGPTVDRLAELGVARISLGSLLYRRALGAALDAMTDIAAGRTPGGTTPSYDEVCALERSTSVSRPANSAG